MSWMQDKNGDKFYLCTKEEFDKQFIVGCLCAYSSDGKPDSIVKIKIVGEVPDLKHCVLVKPKKEKKMKHRLEDTRTQERELIWFLVEKDGEIDLRCREAGETVFYCVATILKNGKLDLLGNLSNDLGLLLDDQGRILIRKA